MNEETNIAERLDELEYRLAFQEDTISQLNEVIARQDGDVSQLKRQVTALIKKLSEFEQNGPDKPLQTDERPPHY